MTLPAHVSGGYLVLNLVNKINPNLEFGSGAFLVIGLIGSVLPDIDFPFSKYVKDHHNSPTHSPLFWLLICTILIFVIGSYGTALIIGILVHLFLDWFGGRTTGIRIFYPLSKKMFSLFPLSPQKGKIPTSIIPTKEYLEYFKFYSQNTFLVISELALMVVAFSVWLGRN